MIGHYKIISQTCFEVAKVIARDFHELEYLQTSKKPLHEFMCNVDRKSENFILQKLRKFNPKYHFFVEDSQYIPPLSQINLKELQYCWVIDPIDGTANFVHSNPNYAISIGLSTFSYSESVAQSCVAPKITSISDLRAVVENYSIVCGGIYIPCFEELYYTEKGEGSYKIDKYNTRVKLKASKRNDLAEVVVGTMSPKNTSDEYERLFAMLKKNQAKFRILGSVGMDMAFLASGRYDMILLDNVYLWDVAAGILLLRELGIELFDKSGRILLGDIEVIDNGLIATSRNFSNFLSF